MTRDILDVLDPYVGRCELCEGPNKRHRLADSIIDGWYAEDDREAVAHEFDVPVDVVDALCEYAEERRKSGKGRWP